MNRKIKILFYTLNSLLWIIVLGVPLLGIVNAPDYREEDLQRPADLHESGYWFDNSGPHLRSFTIEDEDELDA